MGCFKLNYSNYSIPPFGNAIKTCAYSSGAYRYGFNGMEEKDDFNGSGNAYDFGARIYDGRLGRWLSLDPFMRKYSHLSPFNFVNNSPILYVDKDGRDFGLYINHETKTITIKATYYTTAKDKVAAETAVNHWHKENGKYVYQVVGDDGKVMEYDIVFKLEVDATMATKADAKKKAINDPEGNSFKEVHTDGDSPGACHSQERVTVNTKKSQPETGAHEVGHTLGMEHAVEGLMERGTTRKTGEDYITEVNIAQMLQQDDLSQGIDEILVLNGTTEADTDDSGGDFNKTTAKTATKEPTKFSNGGTRKKKSSSTKKAETIN